MRLKALFIMLGMMLGTSATALNFDLTNSPKGFETLSGIAVTVAPTDNSDQVLVQVKGIDHPMNGVVFLTEAEDRADETRSYNFIRDGRERSLLLHHKAARTEYLWVFLPGQGRVALFPSPEQTERIDLPALLTLYEQQKEAGTQSDIARFNRERKVADSQKLLDISDKSANRHCDSGFRTVVDWNSIPDDILMVIKPREYCGLIANEFNYMCREDAAMRKFAQGIQQINCQFGDRLKLDRDDTAIYFQTEKDAPNQIEFVHDYFRNL